MSTVWGVPSFEMFCFVFFQKFRLPIGLHNSCSITPMAGGTCKKVQNFTNVDTPQSVCIPELLRAMKMRSVPAKCSKWECESMRGTPVCRWGCDAFGSVEGGEGGHVAHPGAQEGAEPRQRPHAAAQVRNHHPARQGGGSRRGECHIRLTVNGSTVHTGYSAKTHSYVRGS